jgi:orotate phosphoribosyltransferase
MAIFTYNLPKAEKAFKEADCILVTLTDYDHLIQKALETGYITADDVKILQDFKKSLI